MKAASIVATDTNRQQAECLLATTPDIREHVYSLRYHCYLRNGSIAPRVDPRFSDRFDDEPNSFSFLVRTPAREPVATVRISVVRPDLGWTDSPAAHVFGDHPSFQAIASGSFVEASRLCFLHQARRDAFVTLLGNMAALAEYYDVRTLVACPREEHAHIYQRMFGFELVAPPRQYFGVNFRTALLSIRLDQLRGYVRAYTPMVKAWAEALQRFQAPRCDFAVSTMPGAGSARQNASHCIAAA